MLRITFAIVIAGLTSFGALAQGQETSGPSDSARYTFYRVRDSFLRLDVRTGQVSECAWEASGWFCRVLPDERLTLESEIYRLQDSNQALKKALLERGLPLPDGINPDPPVGKGADGQIRFPSGAGLDRVTTAVGNVWRRMVEMMANLQRDMLRRS